MTRTNRQKDEAEQETDRLIEELEKKTAEEYEQAYEDLVKKCNKYFQDFERMDNEKKALVKSGKMTEQDYKTWRANKMLTGKRWNDMRDTLAEDLTKIDRKVRSMTKGYLPDAYAINHNYETYEIEKGAGVSTSYTLYDRSTVERLIKDNPKLLPDPSENLKKELKKNPDLIWNKQHINSAITQGVLQGEPLDKIAKRLQQVTTMDEKASIRNARTMMTGAQNAGRQAAMARGVELGLEVHKKWIATLDLRTRESHQEMDGVEVPHDEAFPNGLMFPGDPDGIFKDPGEVYNCRCTMATIVPKYAGHDLVRYDQLHGKVIENMTYKEWLALQENEESDVTIES